MTQRNTKSYEDMSKDELIEALEAKDSALMSCHKSLLQFTESDTNPSTLVRSVSHAIKHDINDFMTRYQFNINQS